VPTCIHRVSKGDRKVPPGALYDTNSIMELLLFIKIRSLTFRRFAAFFAINLMTLIVSQKIYREAFSAH